MWIILPILAAAAAAVVIDNYVTRRFNHRRNAAAEAARPVPRLIADQSTLRAYRFGKKTLDYNGCCAVAVYNALRLLEPEAEHRLTDVVRALDTYLGYNAWGLLGGSPPAIGRFFRGRGYRVRFTACLRRRGRASVDACVRASRVGILLYRNPGSLSMHYAAVRWDESDGRFEYFNRNGHAASLDRYLTDTHRQLLGIWVVTDEDKAAE